MFLFLKNLIFFEKNSCLNSSAIIISIKIINFKKSKLKIGKEPWLKIIFFKTIKLSDKELKGPPKISEKTKIK